MKKVLLSIVVLFTAMSIAFACEENCKKACCKKGEAKACAKKDEKACAGKDAKSCSKAKSCCKAKAATAEVKAVETTPAK